MAQKTSDKRSATWRISAETKRLLELLAERSATSQTAVLEQAILEKARREQVLLDPEGATHTPSVSAMSALTPEENAAVERLRELAQRVRAGEDVSPAEVQVQADVLRAGIPITPAERSGPPDPEERERLQRMLDEVRAAVPEEWTEEELIERVNQAVHEVRAARRARGEWPPTEPVFASPQQQALLGAFQALVEAQRARFAGMSQEEIDREVKQADADARENQRARRR